MSKDFHQTLDAIPGISDSNRNLVAEFADSLLAVGLIQFFDQVAYSGEILVGDVSPKTVRSCFIIYHGVDPHLFTRSL